MNASKHGGANSTSNRWFGWVAGGVATALVVTLAVVANGFDSRETPREDPSVWVERAAGQYARVNTETAEIDTVRVAESPSGVVQTGDLGLLLTQGFDRVHEINPASPTDVKDEAASGETDAESEGDAAEGVAASDGARGEHADDPAATPTGSTEGGSPASEGSAAIRTPDGTRQVIATGGFVLYFAQTGAAYLSQVKTGGESRSSLSSAVQIDPLREKRDRLRGDEAKELEPYVADAAAIDEQGRVALYSSAEQAIRWYDAVSGTWRGSSAPVPAGVPAEGVQLAIVDGAWVLFDPAAGNLWLQGRKESIAIDVQGIPRLQGSTTVKAGVLVADEGGLWRIDENGTTTRVVETEGIAAQPKYVNQLAVAAWVDTSGAQMWTSDVGESTLELDESVEDLSNPELEIRSNGSRALIVERRSGMMWTVPDGQLIPVVQWSLVDPPKQESGTVVTQDVTEQEPPIAIDDAFGVRAGEPVLLPVLLNDFDPNRKDVLTVVPEGLFDGMSAEFGAVSSLSDGQGVVVHPSPDAKGSASFSYAITDGVHVSAPATVTLTVVDESTNTAPQWCPVEGCQRAWPSPELAPGGTLIMPALEGWVDLEGDPMMLAKAEIVNPENPLRALVTDDGKLAVRHTDPNAASGDAVVRITVADSRGEATERDLRLRIRTGAAIEFAPAASTATIGEATLLRPLERLTGGSGSFQLVDAVVQQGSLAVTPNQGIGTVEVLADTAGNSLVAVTVRDTVTAQEATGVIRVTAVESRAPFAVPPLRAFVRSLADSTIDVLAAVPGANSRAMTVQSATVADGQLRADVIEHSRVRVSGATADGQPGRIGAVDLIVAEGSTSATGRLTVFQVAEAGLGAIAVADSATVRAGSVVDIPVLENDVAPPGERLVLHPEVGAPGAAGELAFASGGSVRYLAPKEPGEYLLSYTTYGASSPEQSDVGQVRVMVLPTGANRDPLPATVTVRVAPGEHVKALVPLSGVDPDGDRLRLVSVDAPSDSQLSTNIVARSNSIQVEASPNAQRSTQIVSYTVRDSFGGEANGRLRIIVTDPDPGGGAPVVYSDYVRIAMGATEPAVVRPLDNDIDPSGGELQLLNVVPNVPGGESSPLYRELESRLDVTGLKQGVVKIEGGSELGTVSYKYTVRSKTSKSTADGLIVVQVSERIGQQAPAVSDTVLSVRDRADFEWIGVDVVTDRVRWASGDISTLQLSLWGSAADRYTVKGSKIFGSYKAEGDLVPFRLAGTDMTGAEVESFGFLIVPPLDELRLSLKVGVQPISVKENKSAEAKISDLLDLGQGDRIELDQSAFGVQRSQASCEAIDATTIRYVAGREAPWSDSCTIRVRLTKQKTYTTLPIPVSILPDEPVAQLNPLTRTVAPGTGEAVKLADMVQWQGGREGDLSKLRWQASGGGSFFEVTSSGDQVQVQARADAVPGTQEVVTVSVSGSGESQAALTLRVGEAAVDAPKGGTVSLQCTVGSSCSAALIGVGGEYDPFSGKSGGGLHLVSVDGAGCAFGSMQASGDSVNVSWADPRGPGGKCTASFTVRDAQNRTGTGTIEFDAQGVPRAPSNIEATGANATSVTLTVALNSQTAYPSVTGVEVLDEGGSPVASCSASGSVAVCTVNDVPVGKENGRRYLARAVNSVGSSDATSNASAATWAYVAPPKPDVVAEAVKNRNNTDVASGEVRLVVSGSDRARRFLLSIDAGPRAEIGRNSTHTLAPGPHKFSVIPEDRDIPPGYSGGAEGDAGVANVVLGAAPIGDGVGIETLGDDGVKVIGTWDANFAGDGTLELTYGISRRNGDSAYCNTSNSEFPGLQKYATYVAVVCAKSDSGTTQMQVGPIWVGSKPPVLTVTRGYTIDSQAFAHGNVREYITVGGGSLQPKVDGAVQGATIRYVTGAGTSDGSLGSVPVGSGVQVQQCLFGNGTEYCSGPVNVPAAGYASTRVTWNGVCVAEGGDLSSVFTIEGRSAGDATFTKQGAKNIRLSWNSGFNNTDFANAICDAPPPPDPVDPVDPVDPPPPGG